MEPSLRVGWKVSLPVVVAGRHLWQSLPGVVGGSLNTVWHSKFLMETSQTTDSNKTRKGRGINESLERFKRFLYHSSKNAKILM